VIPTVELSWEPEMAIELGTSWGIRHFELKTLWESRRVPFITGDQKDHLKRVLHNYGADVVALSPGLFIGAEADEGLATKEIEEKLLPSIDLAHEFGATALVIFSFKRIEGVGEEWVIDRLAKVVARVEGTGLTLAIEPLSTNYGDSGQALGRLVNAIDSDILGVNWDPANVARAGHKAYPDGYQAVKGLVKYVHLKNDLSHNKQWAVFDHALGGVDLRAQLIDLARDGYDGYLCIETHTCYNSDPQVVVEDSRYNLEVLKRWLKQTF
jgi:sugar phosphate isomerase/epimerase